MGERELCKLEVVGSIPIDSTTLRPYGLRVAQPRGARKGEAVPGVALLGEDGPVELLEPEPSKLEARERWFSFFCLLGRHQLTL